MDFVVFRIQRFADMLSLIIPTNNPKFLQDLLDSIYAQDFTDYEIVLVPNNGANLDGLKLSDKVRIVPYNEKTNYIGKIKKFSFAQAAGDILVEIDHDDLLISGCLAAIAGAFADPDVGFAYSNFAEFQNETWGARKYAEGFGWKYREFDYQGHKLWEVLAQPETPDKTSKIWFAPNHIRAWRRSFYEGIGGHDPNLAVCDDNDLICRSFLSAKKVKHIDKCLYLYRVHGQNSWLQFCAEIQRKTWEIYEKYIYRLCEKWADDHGLLKLDLGGRFDAPAGYKTVDLKDADIVADLRCRWPFADGSVGLIRAHDFLEHLPDQRFTMDEIWRVLAPGGYLLSQTPSTDGRGAWQDPTHQSFWNSNSFFYWTRAEQARFIDNKNLFEVVRIRNYSPNEWTKNNNIVYVEAHLKKPDYVK